MGDNFLIPVWCFVDMLDVSEFAIMHAIKRGDLPSVIDINSKHLIREEDFHQVFPNISSFSEQFSDPYEGMEYEPILMSEEQAARRKRLVKLLREAVEKRNQNTR